MPKVPLAIRLNAISEGWISEPSRPLDVALHLATGTIVTRAEIEAHRGNPEKYVRERLGQYRETVTDFYRGRIKERRTDGFTKGERKIVREIMDGPYRPLRDSEGGWL